ncbi:hypothetical protein PR048_000916 [Dryococelus australis]|uniref:Uncharacterized protein n=1 Tax=Dryococelus australis TaxID=614101 RepID=A0ABQ9IFY2_9NEOP|nr:hypothetical protein PR048_000916 [Dryococelus australis]
MLLIEANARVKLPQDAGWRTRKYQALFVPARKSNGRLLWYAVGVIQELSDVRCHWLVGFLADLPFPPPLHSSAAPYSLKSPSSALKTSLLRAAQISSLHFTSFSHILSLSEAINVEVIQSGLAGMEINSRGKYYKPSVVENSGVVVRLLASGFTSWRGRPGFSTNGGSCWTMPLVSGFSRGLPFSPLLHSGAAPYSPRFALNVSEDLYSPTNITTVSATSSTQGSSAEKFQFTAACNRTAESLCGRLATNQNVRHEANRNKFILEHLKSNPVIPIKSPYDRVKRCRERKINITASERVNNRPPVAQSVGAPPVWGLVRHWVRIPGEAWMLIYVRFDTMSVKKRTIRAVCREGLAVVNVPFLRKRRRKPVPRSEDGVGLGVPSVRLVRLDLPGSSRLLLRDPPPATRDQLSDNKLFCVFD